MAAKSRLVEFARHRMSLWLWITLLLIVAIGFMAPHMLSVLAWKASLLTMAAYLGYWICRAAEASVGRPHELLEEASAQKDPARSWQLEQLAAAAYQRRAWVISACLIAAALGT